MSPPGTPFPRLYVAPRRYDGSPKFRYPVDALELTPKRWVVHGVFGPEIAPHSQRLGFYPGDHTIEFYTPDAWSNVYAVLSEEGLLRGYYCNIGMPPRRQDDEITYVDLDLDLLVRPDGALEVLDEDEYEERAARFGYPPELRRQARAELDALVRAVEQRLPPFDGREAQRFFERVQRGGP